MLRRKASAVWNGSLKEGKGKISSDSGVLRDTQYSFNTRFEDGAGTNPEELIAAAHAGCFSMALAFQLSGAGFTPEELRTDAKITMEKEGAGWTIKSSRLELRARVPGLDEAKFQELAAAAKAGCPVSRLLNAEITLDAKLES